MHQNFSFSAALEPNF